MVRWQAVEGIEEYLKRRVPYWTQYRDISNSAAARAVILVPLIGYWIIFNNQMIEWTKLSKFIDGEPAAAGPPLRLFATYFGLCLVAIASAIYQWKCPDVIKLYPTASMYVGQVGPQMSRIEQDRVELILREGDEESRARHRGQALGSDFAAEPKSEDEIEARRPIIRSNMLQLHYDLCNRSSPLARLGVTYCYRVGVLVLLIPAVDIFWQVSKTLLRKLVC